MLKDENELRNFVGIYILAHYRNRPRDVALILNSPNHFARCIKTRTEKIVNSMHISKEGSLPKQIIESVFRKELPKGHIVPLVICRHYRILDFGYLKGWRIVRIATHPDVMNQGIGSFALKEIENEAKENKLDWIGVSFGATPRLLKFWIRANFIPLHISFERNPVSGEYSVILVKPLNSHAEKLVKDLHYEFRMRLLGSLMDVHFDIEYETPWYLLRPFYDYEPHYTLELTENQRSRLQAFIKEDLPYESVGDVVKELTKYYFLNTSKRPKLTEFEEKILIMKCLLIKTWRKISLALEKESIEIIKAFRKTIKKLQRCYL